MRLTWKNFVLVAGLVLMGVSSRSFADDAKVQVTSFVYVSTTSRVAELCGKVTGASTVSFARITVDVNTSNPGIYNALVGKDGLFCTVVASYRGTADVTLEYLGKTVESGVVAAQAARNR